jgi:uncharacterized membrane protein YoaK (UPF0700 family)
MTSNSGANFGANFGTIMESNGHSLDETTPLLGRPKPSFRHSFQAYLQEDIHTHHADLILLLCYTITGLLDSSSISIWSSFVSMQTGNTVYLGLGLADPYGGTRWIKAATSLSLFYAGSFVFARYHRWQSPRRRLTMASAHLVQATLIVAAALIVTYDATEADGDPLRWQVLVPIALVAFQAAGQAVTSRALKFNALTSVVLTSIYCDLFSDANLFAGFMNNIERNQRAAAPVALLIGVLGGGLWSKSLFGIAGALWTAAGLKGLIVLAWLLWRPAGDGD